MYWRRSSSDVRCACNDIHMLRCSLADKATAETLKSDQGFLLVLHCLVCTRMCGYLRVCQFGIFTQALHCEIQLNASGVQFSGSHLCWPPTRRTAFRNMSVVFDALEGQTHEESDSVKDFFNNVWRLLNLLALKSSWGENQVVHRSVWWFWRDSPPSKTQRR